MSPGRFDLDTVPRHIATDKKSDYSVSADEEPKAKLIAVDGVWYDVTHFIDHHPGGEVITRFVGHDATAVYHAFHKHSGFLKRVKAVGKCDYALEKKDKRYDDLVTAKFDELRDYFVAKGYFETDYKFYAKKFTLLFSLWILTFYFASLCRETPIYLYVAAFTMAAFLQQSGFLMHDSMHTHITKDRKVDHWIGTFTGTVCLGVAGLWWRDEHRLHHGLTCVFDRETNYVDPQMWEDTWAQSEKLFWNYTTPLKAFAVRVQHITFIPFCTIGGRLGIMIDSFVNEKRTREWVAGFVHWTWVIVLLSLIPTWKQRFIFYLLACLGQGVLHIQLLISHYSKGFHDLHEYVAHTNYYRAQIETNINIVNPEWFDWFHGGLNLHIEHHLFPRMSREKYRKARVHVKRLCKELDIQYDECCWSVAIWRTLKHLKQMSDHFHMNPNH